MIRGNQIPQPHVWGIRVRAANVALFVQFPTISWHVFSIINEV